MRRKLVRSAGSALLALSLAFGGFAASTSSLVGCGDDDGNPAEDDRDGGESTTGDDADVGSTDSGAPSTDTGSDASTKRDCSNDAMADGLMKHLECTGLYADFGAKSLANDAKPYRPAIEFWSDGAVKARFLYLPPGTTIDNSNFDAWKFPNGTKVWKEFKIDGKRIETRLYTKDDNGTWRHTTYRWTDDESDAVRKDSGEIIHLAGRPPYEIPNTGQCNDCHDSRMEKLLGVDALELGLPGAEGMTLAALASTGKLSTTPLATALAIPDDGTTKAAPALGWLHANCGACHAQGGTAGYVAFRARILPSQLVGDGGVSSAQSLDAFTSGVCKSSTRVIPDAGVSTYRYIAGGDPDASVVAILSGQRVKDGETPTQDVQMPPLVSRVVDTQGQALLAAWIRELPTCP